MSLKKIKNNKKKLRQLKKERDNKNQLVALNGHISKLFL